MAAIYARVSSEQQREANTIASQTTSLIEFAQERDLEVPKEWQGVLSVIGLVTSTYDFVSLSATPVDRTSGHTLHISTDRTQAFPYAPS
jgi:hypothetical protein